MAREQALLASLNFDARPIRHESIPHAHKKTVFWVSGKAGSGKSTLMKFVANHPTTKQMLDRWSAPKDTAVVTHYFWGAGTLMQRSWLGLLQALLFDILSSVPSLIPIICRDRRAKLGDGFAPMRLGSGRLAHQVLLFIDGLDEFDGEHHELYESIKALSASPAIKLCISSRPWVVFENYFGQDEEAKLCINDLTRNDIREFANSQLQGHPRWRANAIDIVPGGSEDVLIEEIGLTNGDTIDEMQARLKALPNRLENLFKHMLESADPVYHRKMAGIFRLALDAGEPLNLLMFWYYEKEFEVVRYAIRWPVQPAKQGLGYRL
ncbi:hypothetical protein B0T18DRAFT_432797 [Schizothecium vesticola]|uniref:NACHT domain-containing protein n=1 Tax=Schizothecium vesticola TaxID=314040 RepID=A0AA40BP88_9PEZI|nr:hypothetical protein B0T18DRAFT_432797 [Schizothecium vesticola]